MKYWSGNELSLKGRIRVINTWVLSKLWYAGSVQDIPPNVKSEVSIMLNNLIWEGKYSQRTVEGLEEDYLNGGLRLGNIENK